MSKVGAFAWWKEIAVLRLLRAPMEFVVVSLFFFFLVEIALLCILSRIAYIDGLVSVCTYLC